MFGMVDTFGVNLSRERRFAESIGFHSKLRVDPLPVGLWDLWVELKK
jgi:hypothetical protein